MFQNKITVVLAVIFLANSVWLARIQGEQATSKFDGEAPIVAPLNSDAINEADAAADAKTQGTEEAIAEDKTEAKTEDTTK